jgi:2'-5' RNA ligase
MVQGFPLNDSLSALRGQLRRSFKASGLEHSIDQRYTLDTAHSTVIRFKAPFADPARFVDYLKKYRDDEFGVAEIPRIELVHNDWYMSHARVSRHGVFTLGD